MPTGALRRVMLLVLLAAAGGAVLAWLRQRSTAGDPVPQWPAMQPLGVVDEPPVLRAVDSTPSTAPSSPPSTAAWRPPDDAGNPPAGFPVKVKESSGIFHVPGGRFYDRTRPDRCYPTPAAAEADGYRRSKS